MQGKTILHGTAVLLKSPVFGNGAVFIRGASGSGKSDLAFRLIALGGELICDDQVQFEKRHDRLMAASIDTIKGLLEVRGVGLLHYPVAMPAAVMLVVDLLPRADVPRLPEWGNISLCGISVPRLQLHAFDASTPQKIFKAMEVVANPEMIVE